MGKFQQTAKTSLFIICKKALALLFLGCQLFSIYKTEKKILIYRKYIHNSSQSDFNLLADYINIKILIISIMSLDFFRRQDDAVIQPTKRNQEQSTCCKNISSCYSPIPNCKSLAYLIDKIVQSNQVVIKNEKAI